MDMITELKTEWRKEKWKAAQSRTEEGMDMGWKSDSARL